MTGPCPLAPLMARPEPRWQVHVERGPSRHAMPHVILIEDDALVRKLLERRLQAEGLTVTALRDGRGAAELIATTPVDLVLVDLGLPHVDGLSILERLRAQGINVPVLVLTAFELPHLYATVRGMGANGLVQKPYDLQDLVGQVLYLLAA